MNTTTHELEGIRGDLILDTLQSFQSNLIDDKNCQRFIQILDSINCLVDPLFGNCMLWEANLCLCPSWLKCTVKVFLFVNIYSAFLQVQSEKITLTGLKGGWNNLHLIQAFLQAQNEKITFNFLVLLFGLLEILHLYILYIYIFSTL